MIKRGRVLALRRSSGPLLCLPKGLTVGPPARVSQARSSRAARCFPQNDRRGFALPRAGRVAFRFPAKRLPACYPGPADAQRCSAAALQEREEKKAVVSEQKTTTASSPLPASTIYDHRRTSSGDSPTLKVAYYGNATFLLLFVPLSDRPAGRYSTITDFPLTIDIQLGTRVISS